MTIASLTLLHIIVLLVALQRLAELLYATHNSRRLLAAGGREVGAGHYPALVLLHLAWLLTLLFAVPADAPINWWLIAFFLLLQVGRLWVMISLGRFWTTRIITLPNAPLVRRGPYRFLRHPNYLIVVLEIAVLPLAFGAVWIALIFSLLNLLLLSWRIRVEEDALAQIHDLYARMEESP